MTNKSLLDIKIGETAKIKKLNNPVRLKNRLLDLGLVPESKTSLLFEAPSGDPRAFFIKGAVIALRCGDCEKIEVEEG